MKTRHTIRFAICCFVSMMAVSLVAQAQEAAGPKASGAKLIFATTTPYPKGVRPCRLPEDAVHYNTAALKIMKANHIQVNDLYSLVLPNLKTLQKPRNVHFKKEGSKVLADQVAAVIQSAL